MHIKKLIHRIIEWLGLERTPRIIKFQLPYHRHGHQPPEKESPLIKESEKIHCSPHSCYQLHYSELQQHKLITSFLKKKKKKKKKRTVTEQLVKHGPDFFSCFYFYF